MSKPTGRPCGPRDRRLIGHRCRTCKLSRLRCDGARPCSRCRDRGIDCAEPTGGRPRTIEILQYMPPASRTEGQQHAEAKASSPDHGDILEAFFSLIGHDGSPYTVVFSRPVLEPLLREPGPILDVSMALGRLALSSGKLHTSQEQAIITATREKLRSQMDELLRSDGTWASELTVLFVALKCMFEIMTDKEGFEFIGTMARLLGRVRYPFPKKIPWWTADEDLLIFYCIGEIYRGLILDIEPTLPLLEEAKATSSANTSTPDAERALLKHFSDFLTVFSRCNSRSLAISADARERRRDRLNATDTSTSTRRTSEESNPDEQDRERTMSAILTDASEALRLAKAFQTGPWTALPTAADPRHFASLAPAFYNCGLIVVARVFFDPLWEGVDDQPGAEYLHELEARALSALAVFEARLPYVGLEAIMYTTLLMAISLEVKSSEARARVAMMFRALEVKGFVVARTYVEDICLAWSAVPSYPPIDLRAMLGLE